MKESVKTKDELINLIKTKFKNYFYGEFIGEYIYLNGENVFKVIIK